VNGSAVNGPVVIGTVVNGAVVNGAVRGRSGSCGRAHRSASLPLVLEGCAYCVDRLVNGTGVNGV